MSYFDKTSVSVVLPARQFSPAIQIQGIIVIHCYRNSYYRYTLLQKFILSLYIAIEIHIIVIHCYRNSYYRYTLL